MFKEGQEVFVTIGTAKGNTGIIVEIDNSCVPYLVKFKNGKTYWKCASNVVEVQPAQAKPTFQEGQEVWVAFKDCSNRYKATVIATGEHFTCVLSWSFIANMKKHEIVENERVFALDYAKVKTIKIGEFEVPEPLREAPGEGTRYHCPDLQLPNKTEEHGWEGDKYDLYLLQRGLVHLTKEAAELHARALLSFTTTEQR
jgi:hypothetical protein